MQTAIAAGSEECATLKRVGLAMAITDALKTRGVPGPAASLAAEIGILALKTAHARWSEPTNRQELAVLSRQSLRGLQTAGTALS